LVSILAKRGDLRLQLGLRLLCALLAGARRLQLLLALLDRLGRDRRLSRCGRCRLRPERRRDHANEAGEKQRQRHCGQAAHLRVFAWVEGRRPRHQSETVVRFGAHQAR